MFLGSNFFDEPEHLGRRLVADDSRGNENDELGARLDPGLAAEEQPHRGHAGDPLWFSDAAKIRCRPHFLKGSRIVRQQCAQPEQFVKVVASSFPGFPHQGCRDLEQSSWTRHGGPLSGYGRLLPVESDPDGGSS